MAEAPDRMRVLSDAIPKTLVYALAPIRRGPYYIEVAQDLEAVERRIETLQHRRLVAEGAVYDPLKLAWHEVCGSEAQARMRAAEVRAMPLRWQRRLIEAQNPDWVGQVTPIIMESVQLCFCIPETAPKTQPQGSENWLRPDRFESLKARRQQWREALARLPPSPRALRHRIPVYGSGVPLAEMCDGLWAHGLVVHTAPKPLKQWPMATPIARPIPPALVHEGLRRLRQVPDAIGSVDWYAVRVPDYGIVHVIYGKRDEVRLGSLLEHLRALEAVAVAAMRCWMRVGKPERYLSDLEVDMAAGTAQPYGSATRNPRLRMA